MSKFKVPSGGKIVIEIAADKPTRSGKQTPQNKKYIGVDPEEDPQYVFRGGNISFYDLGVRAGEPLDFSTITPASGTRLGFSAFVEGGFVGLPNGICGGGNGNEVTLLEGDQFGIQAGSNWAISDGVVYFEWNVSSDGGLGAIVASGAYSVAGGVPSSPGSTHYEFAWDSDVEVVSGLNVGFCTVYNPSSPFAGPGGLVKTWNNVPSYPGAPGANAICNVIQVAGSSDEDANSGIYNGLLLGGDIETSLRLPHNSEWLYLDLIIRTEEDKYILIGEINKRPYNKDLPAGEDAPESENVDQTQWSGTAVKLKSGGGHIAVDGRIFYNSFDTLDEKWKVTETPDPNGEAADLIITPKEKIKVYLTPRIYNWAGGTPETADEHRIDRLPVGADFANVSPLSPFLKVYVDGATIAEPTDGYWGNVFAHFGDTQDLGGNFGVQEYGGIPSHLAAIIVRGEEKFYVWQMASDSRANLLHHP